MRGSLLSLLMLGSLLGAVSAQASHLDGDVFTFDTPPDSFTWSHTTTTTLARFPGDPKLGPFLTETVTLQGMDYLGGTANFTNRGYLSFDLLLSGNWSGQSGDDHFIVTANGQTLLDATFSNLPSLSQSYPSPGSPGGTGSSYFVSPFSGYSLSFQFALHPQPQPCCADVFVSFRGTGPGNWYLDNVVVSSTPIPEPHPALLVTSGLFALGARRRLAQGDC